MTILWMSGVIELKELLKSFHMTIKKLSPAGMYLLKFNDRNTRCF